MTTPTPDKDEVRCRACWREHCDPSRCTCSCHTPDRKPNPQTACSRCSVGVMDQSNPHLYGGCKCDCHATPDKPRHADREWRHGLDAQMVEETDRSDYDVSDKDGSWECEIRSAAGGLVACAYANDRTTALERAKWIYIACNSHDALVQALKNLLRGHESILDEIHLDKTRDADCIEARAALKGINEDV